MRKPYEYGDCQGKAGFDMQEMNGEYRVSVGF